MCLAVPGRILSISEPQGAPEESLLLRCARVDFAGIIKEISLGFVPEARVGDYVIAHVGVAISRLDEREAERVFDYLREMDELRALTEEAP